MWVEIRLSGDDTDMDECHSLWGVWVEIGVYEQRPGRYRVTPFGECGLKLNFESAQRVAEESLPLGSVG